MYRVSRYIRLFGDRRNDLAEKETPGDEDRDGDGRQRLYVHKGAGELREIPVEERECPSSEYRNAEPRRNGHSDHPPTSPR